MRNAIKANDLHPLRVETCEYLGEIKGKGKCGCQMPPSIFHCTKQDASCILSQRTIRAIEWNDGTESDIEPSTLKVCNVCKYRTHDKLVYTKTTDLVRDTYKLVKYVPPRCNGIIGIPRSGMLPASILATHMQLPLGELRPDGSISMLGSGGRGKFTRYADGKYFIVDDTCHNGYSLQQAKKSYKGNDAIWAVVYNRDKNRMPDVYAVDLSVHLLEYNCWNNGQINGQSIVKNLQGGFAVDLFVIMEKKADIKTSPPIMVPRLHAVPLVIGHLPEASRSEVEDWLRKYQINVNQLVLYDGDDIASFKGLCYKDSNCGVFFENDINQCQGIANAANKPVIHPESGKVVYSD
jgi:hypothetical protein